jgi:hypothetical protein
MIKQERDSGNATSRNDGNLSGHKADSVKTGIFYRQELPYSVELSGVADLPVSTQVQHESLVFSPSESAVFFLPVNRSFFGSNEATIGLADGTPTSYGQVVDGEALGLLKLPAEVFTAYFKAVGETFSAFGTNAENEKIALEKELQLELQKVKFEACLEAIRNEDTDQIEALGC